MNLLVVRLGAMGDVIHALPAVASLRRSYPRARIAWAIEPRWAELLDGNPQIDDVLLVERTALRRTWQRLRRDEYDVAVDFQGLLKSAAVVLLSGAERSFGFARPRERLAGVFYTNPVATAAVHIVERNLELARAAGATASDWDFPIPAGRPEGGLPALPFVLASPLGGWKSKQWPLEYYGRLAQMLDMPLVLNGPPSSEPELRSVPECRVHLSGIAGLIDATRRAAAVIGIDSGPMHLAAVLRKPGVAIFGPTDPARNGPCGGSLQVMRHPAAATTYKRRDEIDESMRAISPEAVARALLDGRIC